MNDLAQPNQKHQDIKWTFNQRVICDQYLNTQSLQLQLPGSDSIYHYYVHQSRKYPLLTQRSNTREKSVKVLTIHLCLFYTFLYIRLKYVDRLPMRGAPKLQNTTEWRCVRPKVSNWWQNALSLSLIKLIPHQLYSQYIQCTQPAQAKPTRETIS